MDKWKPRATRAFGPTFAGYFFLTMGISAMIAAFTMPWYFYDINGALLFVPTLPAAPPPHLLSPNPPFSCTVSYISGSTLATGWMEISEVRVSGYCVQVKCPTFFLLIGAVISYVGVFLFLFPAWVMASVAACRLRGVATAGVAPPLGCCAPSFPAIQGLAWYGLYAATIGAAVDCALFCGVAQGT